MDYLRGLAALAVAWFHLTNTYGGSWVTNLGSYGWLGVEVFFVISGFVIPYSLWSPNRTYTLRLYPVFLLKRLVRIEPPYLTSILLVVLLGFASALAPAFNGPRISVEFERIAAHFLYLVPLTPYSWLQPVYWTLAYEFCFYLIIGISFPLLIRCRAFSIGLVAMTCAIVSLQYIDPLVIFFAMGYTAFRAISVQDPISQTILTIVACSITMMLVGAILPGIVGAIVALIIIFSRRIPSIPHRVAAPLSFLAAISYSLYLIHVPIGGRIINLGRRFIEGDLGYLGLSFFALVSCLFASWVFWWLVERPSQILANRIRF